MPMPNLWDNIEELQDKIEVVMPKPDAEAEALLIDKWSKLNQPTPGNCTFYAACSFRNKNRECAFPRGCGHRILKLKV